MTTSVSKNEFYDNPLIGRYASREMCGLWSPQRKHSTWRRLWLALAEAEAELGLPVTAAQIDEMRLHLDDIDFTTAAAYEKKLRHDVMAHVHTFGDACPLARPIIHLGATSCYVTDNTDLILLRDALQMVRGRLVSVIHRLAEFAVTNRNQPCLAFTHLQPAQPTTLGKRACLWAYDFVLDLAELEHRIDSLRAHGSKGTTGTQASFLELFGGDHERVLRLDQIICEKIGFTSTYSVTGQTYPRKVDAMVLGALSGIAQSASKFSTDLRILQHRKEVEEPFEKSQIGSSAMAYKRNPMRSERIGSLSRYVIQQEGAAAMTAATQWFERTLDDSACRRLYLPQSFLGIDAVLILCQNVTDGLVVYPKVIGRNLDAELPFMATENILMDAVQQGGDRQELHERIRVHSQDAAARVKRDGETNDLMDRLAADPAFAGLNLSGSLDAARYVGRAPQQVDEFIHDVVEPIRNRYADSLNLTGEVRV